MSKQQKIFWTAAGILTVLFLCLLLSPHLVHAAGLVEEGTGSSHAAYPLDHYQLDFYVDTGWDWLPWNWTDGVGKQVHYGLYAITNFIWTVSLYVSSATGYLVQQAYSLDFISSTAEAIGKNMQTLSGISENGLQSSGFYSGFLLLFLLLLGIYVAYVGVLKRQTSKASSALFHFIFIFLLSASFLAYAPEYISKINDFSADISKASLDLGTKMIMKDSGVQGKDSTDLTQDTLFAIQVEKPWYLLQYGDSENGSTDILGISPDTNKGKDREEAVKKEIEEQENQYLTLPKTITRLGMVTFIFCFNLGISVFIFLLSGIMIFSQILFIIYAMFLPISFLLSMLPSFHSMGKRALLKLFNTIMLRSGITLIITAAFSISAMLYTLSSSYPFFLIAFLQIVTFAGIYFKLGDLMSLFHLQSSDSQQIGSRIFRRPRSFFQRSSRKLERQLGKMLSGSAATAASEDMLESKQQKPKGHQRTPYQEQGDLSKEQADPSKSKTNQATRPEEGRSTLGQAADGQEEMQAGNGKVSRKRMNQSTERPGHTKQQEQRSPSKRNNRGQSPLPKANLHHQRPITTRQMLPKRPQSENSWSERNVVDIEYPSSHPTNRSRELLFPAQPVATRGRVEKSNLQRESPIQREYQKNQEEFQPRLVQEDRTREERQSLPVQTNRSSKLQNVSRSFLDSSSEMRPKTSSLHHSPPKVQSVKQEQIEGVEKVKRRASARPSVEKETSAKKEDSFEFTKNKKPSQQKSSSKARDFLSDLRKSPKDQGGKA